MRIQAGEQRCARRAAPRGVVELRETHALAREFVEVRRRNFAAVAAGSEKPTSSTRTTTMLGCAENDE
jgi:hypothetical protein